MAVINRLFDEEFYLQSYPDIAAAVTAGQIPSGLAHFLASGIQEGRTRISRFYRDDVEARYLAANPDVAAAVAAGGLASGLQHYLGTGEAEGRSLFTDGFDEEWYRRRYPDVAEAINQGVFTSGLEHYLAFGRDEIRSVSPLFELNYYAQYTDVLTSRDNGGPFLSAADHFAISGEAEGRGVLFSGTQGNDTIVGSSAAGSAGIDTLTGVELDVGQCFVTSTLVGGQCREYDSRGVNEQDILIGGPGADAFELAVTVSSRSGSSSTVVFYSGSEGEGFARIQNLDVEQDVILYPTLSPEISPFLLRIPPLSFEVQGGDTHIFVTGRSSNDLIAIVEGVTDPSSIRFGSTASFRFDDRLL
ncbi:MAG: hypothetical protein AAGA67_12285 [Cyanobacteria bacterium P01_F01_bin.153]